MVTRESSEYTTTHLNLLILCEEQLFKKIKIQTKRRRSVRFCHTSFRKKITKSTPEWYKIWFLWILVVEYWEWGTVPLKIALNSNIGTWVLFWFKTRNNALNPCSQQVDTRSGISGDIFQYQKTKSMSKGCCMERCPKFVVQSRTRQSGVRLHSRTCLKYSCANFLDCKPVLRNGTCFHSYGP